MSADELAELPEFKPQPGDAPEPRTVASDTKTVLRVLHEMTGGWPDQAGRSAERFCPVQGR